jgi:D-amino-acid oxidase
VRATIVGAGVSGLTTASALLRDGWEVDIIGREMHESAVSMVAGAVWTTTAALPANRTQAWAIISWEQFDRLVDDPTCGVSRMRHFEYERNDPGPSTWESTRFLRRMASDELPPGYETGFEIDGFIIEPPTYLAWLRDQVTGSGATLSIGEVERLVDLDGDLVVNCSGLGASQLVGDDSMYPIRGQVVIVANPGVQQAISDESDIDRIAYLYPRSDDIVLGGVRQTGNFEKQADPATTERILADCAVLDPRVAGLDVLDVRVGLRPGRPLVRVEQESLSDGRPVVHNYGHGGAGFILSWGCAANVRALASEEKQ